MNAARAETEAPPRESPDLQNRAANANMKGAPLPEGVLAMKRLSDRLDDGTLMRWVFCAILAGAITLIGFDFIEEAGRAPTAAPPGFDLPGTAPVLPPSLSDGEPPAPPAPVTTDAELLREPMTFELVSGGTLAARGAIDPGAAERFAAEVEARGEYIDRILLDSPGGAVDSAIAIGRLIRENGFATHVAEGALCASSCPLVMAGGASRSAEEGAVVGVHQIYGASDATGGAAEAMSRAQNATARVGRYLDEMGIENGLWLHALETPPDRLYYLSPEEMDEVSLTTPAQEEDGTAAAAR